MNYHLGNFHIGPVRLGIVAILFVFMCVNALGRRLTLAFLREVRRRAIRSFLRVRPPDPADLCRDCLNRGVIRLVASVEFGQPTCLECADVRRQELAAVLAEAEASKGLLGRS